MKFSFKMAIVFTAIFSGANASAEGDVVCVGSDAVTVAPELYSTASALQEKLAPQTFAESMKAKDNGSGIYLYGEKASRPEGYDAGVGYKFNHWVGAEVQWLNDGKQPDGIKNRNKNLSIRGVLDLPIVGEDGVVTVPHMGDLDLQLAAGVTTSRFGYNGSGNDYKNDTWFTGQTVGFGVNYHVTQHISIIADSQFFHRQQVDKPDYEPYFYHVGAGVEYRFGKSNDDN